MTIQILLNNQATALPGMVGRSPGLGPLAYEFVLANWEALARLAGDGPFGGRNWLLPGALDGSADPVAAQRLLADQQRVVGASGVSTAERVAASIVERHRLREREAGPLAQALLQ